MSDSSAQLSCTAVKRGFKKRLLTNTRMSLSRHLESDGQMPWGRFVTTYRRDYTPFSKYHLQVNQLKPRSDAGAVFPLISPLQTGNDFWSTFYKTSNSEYGSLIFSQPPSYSLSPTLLPQCGIDATHVLGAVGSTLTEARTQNTAVKEAWPVEERGQLQYVLDGKGVIDLQSCKDQERPACREPELLHHLLHLPVVNCHIAMIKGAENVDNNAFLTGLTACGLRSSAYLQPFPEQCSCCAWKTELPHSCCYQMHTFPPCIHHGSAQPAAPTQLSREPVLTEYQASYSAQRNKPEIQLISVGLPHHHQILHQPL